MCAALPHCTPSPPRPPPSRALFRRMDPKHARAICMRTQIPGAVRSGPECPTQQRGNCGAHPPAMRHQRRIDEPNGNTARCVGCRCGFLTRPGGPQCPCPRLFGPIPDTNQEAPIMGPMQRRQCFFWGRNSAFYSVQSILPCPVCPSLDFMIFAALPCIRLSHLAHRRCVIYVLGKC